MVRNDRWWENGVKCWLEIPNHFENVKLDEFIVMPNHVHGIIAIVETRHATSLHQNTWQRYHPNLDHYQQLSVPTNPRLPVPFANTTTQYLHGNLGSMIMWFEMTNLLIKFDSISIWILKTGNGTEIIILKNIRLSSH